MINETLRKNINVDKPNLIPIFSFKEGDNALLKLALFKNSTEFDITGQTVRLGAKTKSGLIEQIDGFTISKNNLDIKLKNSILVAGKIEIDLEIKDTNGVMTTASFFIVVNQKVLNDEAVEATNEFDTFTKAIDKVESAVKTVNEFRSSLDNIENELNELKEDIDLSNYATKVELNTKADSTAVTSHTSNNTIHITSDERSSLNTAYVHSQSPHAPANAEANVQADWNVSDTSSDAYIKNKPVIPKAYDDSEIRSSLDNITNEVNELKQGNIEIDLSSYAKKSDLEVKADKS